MKLLKFVLGFVAVVLIAIGLSFLVLDEPLPIAGEDYTYTSHSESYDLTLTPLDALDIRLQNRDIVIRESSQTEEISVYYATSEVNTITFEVVGTKLIVSENEMNWIQQFIAMWNMTYTDRVVEIVVPDDYVADTVQLMTLNGSVDILSGLESRSFGVQTSNGDVEARELQADSLLLSSMNGSIIVHLSDITLDAEVTTLNGSLYISDVTADELTLETANGGIELETVTVDQLIAVSMNGEITAEALTARLSDVSTSNGDIDLDYTGVLSASVIDELRLSTSNGSLYYNDVKQMGSNSTYSITGTGEQEIICHTANGTIRVK